MAELGPDPGEEAPVATAEACPPLAHVVLAPFPDLNAEEKYAAVFAVAMRDLAENLEPELDLRHHPERLPLLHTYALTRDIPTAPTMLSKLVLLVLIADWDGESEFGERIEPEEIAPLVSASVEDVRDALYFLCDTGAVRYVPDEDGAAA